MMGKTHHVGGTVAALGAFTVLQHKGLLIPDCNEFVQFMMMYPFASFGSVFPDLDQNSTSNIPSKDPLVIGVHKLIKATGAKHRDWQTHSVYFTGSACFMLTMLAYYNMVVRGVTIESAYMLLAILGFSVGVLSHLVLDAMTKQGIPFLPLGFKTLRFVPKTNAFLTDSPWETGVRKVLTFIVWLQVLWLLYDVLKGYLPNTY